MGDLVSVGAVVAGGEDVETGDGHFALDVRQVAGKIAGYELLMVALSMIADFGPASEAPGFRWKPSADWLCRRQ